MWSVGVVLFVGLPTYYRQAPGNIPSFYPSLFRRKIIIVRFRCLPSGNLCVVVVDQADLSIAAVVLCCRSDTELLPIRPVRPELAIPMVEPSSASVADSDSDHSILYRYMGRIPLHLLSHVEKPFVGAPCICHGTRRPSLGTDPLEYVKHGSVSALDSGTDRKWSGWTVIVVVVGSTRCSARRR